MDLSVGAPRLDVVRAWGLQRHIITLEWANTAQVNVGSDPSEGQAMRGRPPPTLDGDRAWGEMDLSVGAPRLDGVRAWGLHRHIIALEWDNVTQVIVG